MLWTNYILHESVVVKKPSKIALKSKTQLFEKSLPENTVALCFTISFKTWLMMFHSSGIL